MRPGQVIIPTLPQRQLELERLALPGAVARIFSGRELRYSFSVAPGDFSRLYQCLLKVRKGYVAPDVFVLHPDLSILASGRRLPHTYRHKGRGTHLCLFSPQYREWAPQMDLVGSQLAWTVEWLGYFEDWLLTGEWGGGGTHPDRTTHTRQICARISVDREWRMRAASSGRS